MGKWRVVGVFTRWKPVVRSHYDPPDQKSTDELSAFFCFKRQQLAWKKRINFLALQAINLLPSYSAQPSCENVRCRAFLMPARIVRLGPASVKNWATKNLGEVLKLLGWWFSTYTPLVVSELTLACDFACRSSHFFLLKLFVLAFSRFNLHWALSNRLSYRKGLSLSSLLHH
jgi:hypothetical protein